MKKDAFTGTLCVVLASVIWGVVGLFVRQLTAAGLGTLDTVFLRAFIGVIACGLYLLIFNRELFRFRLKDIWCFLGTGILNMLGCAWLHYTGIQYTSLSVMTVLVYTGPAFAMLFGVLLFGEKFTAKKVLALILTFVGCCFVSGIGSDFSLGWQGLLLGIGAGIGYSMYSVFARYAINRGYGSWTISFYSFLFCMLASAPLADLKAIGTAFCSGASMAVWMILFGLFEAFFSYLLYSKGLEKIESGHAAVLASVEPLTATILGTAFYHEPLTFSIILGICFVLSGLVVLGLKGKKPSA